MEVGLVVPNFGRDAVRCVQQAGQVAEHVGLHSLWLTDHVVATPADRGRTGTAWLEALSSCAYLAATTQSVRLGLSVLVAPYRDPVYTAKSLATMDRLSDGRLTVGVGTGWSADEFRVLGRGEHYPRRGELTDDALRVYRACWAGDRQPLGPDGPTVLFRPAPRQEPGPPVWIGGTSPAALRRAARFGDAWHPTGITASQVHRLGSRLDELAERHVHRAPRVRISEPAQDHVRQLISEFRAVGSTALVLETGSSDLDDWSRDAATITAAAEKESA